MSLDFCCNCGCWVGANEGTMRPDVDGESEIICAECSALEQNTACSIGHDARSGTLDSEKRELFPAKD